MVSKGNEITKLYYSIGEIAEMFNVSKSLVRFWESEFDILKPHKNSKGERRFTAKNIEQFKMIYHLVKERGFTLEGAKQEIKNNKKNLVLRNKTLTHLKAIRAFMIDIQDELGEEE